MRVRSRLVLGFCGLALSAPAAIPASAAPQDGQPVAVTPSAGGAPVINLQQAAAMDASPGAMPPAMTGPSTTPGAGPVMAAPASAPVAGTEAHHHHGLFGWRHCVQCQRARAKSVDGVDVPPPPGYPGAPAMAAGETIISGPVVVSERVVMAGDPNAPGYAVVGGQEPAPGYAVVNGQAEGAEPAPIGMARGAHATPVDPRMPGAAPRPGAGPYDPSVMQSSLPPAQNALTSNPGGSHSHIVRYVKAFFGVGRIHDELEEKHRDKHSAIAYGDPNQKVIELPASMVYGQK